MKKKKLHKTKKHFHPNDVRLISLYNFPIFESTNIFRTNSRKIRLNDSFEKDESSFKFSTSLHKISDNNSSGIAINGDPFLSKPSKTLNLHTVYFESRDTFAEMKKRDFCKRCVAMYVIQGT